MPTIKDIRLVATELKTGVVPLCKKGREIRLRGTAIITGENNQRVVGNPLAIQLCQNQSQAVVGLHDKVRVIVQVTFTLPLFGWCHGGMG